VEVVYGPMVVNIDDRFDYGEDRLIGVGSMKNMIAIIVFVEKDADVIRIFSARKADENESKQFKKEIQNRLG
jgi:uncharacterized DUF497 family protein